MQHTPAVNAQTGRSDLGPYGIVPRWAIEAVQGDLSAGMVYVVLATYSSGDEAVWPHQETIGTMLGISERTVRRAITKLEKLGLLVKSARLDKGRKVGNAYVVVTRSGPDTSDRSADRTPVTATDRTPVAGRITTRLTNEQTSAIEAFFDAFWSAYPRKVDKRRALEKFTARVRSGCDPELLIASATNYARAMQGKEAEYIKHGATFLNADDGTWSEWQTARRAAATARREAIPMNDGRYQ